MEESNLKQMGQIILVVQTVFDILFIVDVVNKDFQYDAIASAYITTYLSPKKLKAQISIQQSLKDRMAIIIILKE